MAVGVTTYRCRQCQRVISIGVPELPETIPCERYGCTGKLRPVLPAPGAKFKGDGFFKNDG